ncbi:MAG: radical SAM protein [Calditrichaeota bacterium]|nr:radical SAM protein [Calditrichota bacterium]
MPIPPFQIVLISTYELGRQPFGLASPAAWLQEAGFTVTCTDCAVEPFPAEAVRRADAVAFYVPMHTATRLAVGMIERVKALNPQAHLCFYGLYAPVNASYLRRLGAQSILGGEFESGLVQLCQRLRGEQQGRAGHPQVEPQISLTRQSFRVPQRGQLPPLSRYAQMHLGNGTTRITGYVEATRGCKHTCRHCPIVPVYNGRFRVVQKEVVLADIRQQVEMGAQHITFGDPDFLNGPGHVLPIVNALHREFPKVTYDVTIKIEHLLKYQKHLPRLRDTGCLLVTSAVEAVDDRILSIFDKGHTRSDFIRAVRLLDEVGLALNPTFVAFNPWITLEGYRDLLQTVAELDLVGNISPVQYAIRLLIPEGSRLLELPETRAVLGAFNQALLSYEWRHPDPRVDALQQQVLERVNNTSGMDRHAIFENIWTCVNEMSGSETPSPRAPSLLSRAEIPYLNEPWYC